MEKFVTNPLHKIYFFMAPHLKAEKARHFHTFSMV